MRTLQLTNQANLIYSESDFPNPDIQYIWELNTLSSDNNTVEFKIIPDGCIDIVFEVFEGTLYNPVISAPFSLITSIQLPENSKFLGIRFKPGKFRKYIDINPNELVSDFVDFGRNEYPSITDFLDSVRISQSNPLAKFDNSLTSLLKSTLSKRQKRRIFRSSTGFSIRQYKKIMNFQSSLLNPNELIYFDQSHQIKAYQSLVNMTPHSIQKYL